jgi:hypothetical protein
MLQLYLWHGFYENVFQNPTNYMHRPGQLPTPQWKILGAQLFTEVTAQDIHGRE